MAGKLALNVLYNIGIIVALIIAYEGLTRGRYEYLIGALFIGGVFIMLKMKLMKEVREKTGK